MAWNKLYFDPEKFLTIPTDSFGYYQYLPGFFIEGDLKHLHWAAPLDNGNTISFFNLGIALLWLPFFLVSHVFANWFNYPTTGYSAPYAIGVLFSVCFYTSAAIYCLSVFLKNYVNQAIAILTALLLLFATNLLYYATGEFAMSHAYTFSIMCIYLLTLQKFKNPTLKKALVLAFLGALIILIKPNNGILLLFTPFLGATNFQGVWQNICQFIKKPFWLFAMGLVLFIVILPQMLYWNHISGKWILYSYGKEGFNWLKPKLWQVLFHPQNGLFLYTPILLLAVAGLILMWKKMRLTTIGILLVWSIGWYIIASWWAWWFGAAFGHRAFIELFPLMAIPLALCIQWLFSGSWLRKILSTGLLAFLLFVNLRLVKIYMAPWDGPDWGWANYIEVLQIAIFK